MSAPKKIFGTDGVRGTANIEPVTAETGIRIHTVTPVSYARIKAQVQSGNYEFDMTSINSMLWLRASREGLAEPIDWSIFKKGTLPEEAWVLSKEAFTHPRPAERHTIGFEQGVPARLDGVDQREIERAGDPGDIEIVLGVYHDALTGFGIGHGAAAASQITAENKRVEV